MDIQRHLNNEPVMARHLAVGTDPKISATQSARFSLWSAVAAALLIGTVVSTRLFDQERDARA